MTDPNPDEPAGFADHASAWVACWAALEPVRRSSTADMGQYSVSYASLGETVEAVKPILAAHGFAVVQRVTGQAGEVILETELVHSTGGAIRSGAWAVGAGKGPQAAGSAVSYLRRYQLTALLCLSTEDDDGNAAEAAQPETTPETRYSPENPRMVTDAQIRRLQVAYRELGITDPLAKLDRLQAAFPDRDLTTHKQLTAHEASLYIDQLVQAGTPQETAPDAY